MPNLDTMQREQESDHAALERAVVALENKLAGINPKLRPEAIREETAKHRREASDSLRNVVISMNNRAQAAQEMARVHSREAELRLARFHNDDALNSTMEMSLLMRLGKTPTRELIEHLQDAVEARNPARVEAVRLEFESRDGELIALGPEVRAEARRNFNEVLSKLELPNAKAAQRTIGRIAQLAAFGQERFTSATTGRSDPVARMNAARMAV